MHSHLENSTAIAQRLRDLPAELPPPMEWTEFQRHMNRRPVSMWRYAALAAGLAAFVAGTAMWSRLGPIQYQTQTATAQAELPMLALPDPKSLAQAKVSERWLARLPAEPAVMRVGTRSAVADLEDRIAWMDDVMSDESLDAVNPSHLVALQHERARLVNSLAQVRYAETLVAAAP